MAHDANMLIRLPSALKAQVEAAALRQGIKASSYIRAAINSALATDADGPCCHQCGARMDAPGKGVSLCIICAT